jgi:hypothetical protein
MIKIKFLAKKNVVLKYYLATIISVHSTLYEKREGDWRGGFTWRGNYISINNNASLPPWYLYFFPSRFSHDTFPSSTLLPQWYSFKLFSYVIFELCPLSSPMIFELPLSLPL